MAQREEEIRSLSDQLAVASSNARETLRLRQELESFKQQLKLKEEEERKCMFFDL